MMKEEKYQEGRALSVEEIVYVDNNLNGFSVPMRAKDNSEYKDKLEQTLKKYVEYINCPAFIYAENLLSQILNLFKGDPFLISELDKSYSFRSIAPFCDLHSEGYDETCENILNKELTFFRVRTKKIGNEELYASVFIPNESGKKLKVLNLTISQYLISGIFDKIIDVGDIRKNKLQVAMLKIFPLVIATLFSVDKEDEKIKYQYLLSQALMRVVNRNGIDGIAYFSMKGKNEFQFPQGVNLAIPATDISDSRLYSKKCKEFEISKPIRYCGQEGKESKSYINEVFTKYDSDGTKSFTAQMDVDGKKQFYGETSYGKFDDLLTESLRKNS